MCNGTSFRHFGIFTGMSWGCNCSGPICCARRTSCDGYFVGDKSLRLGWLVEELEAVGAREDDVFSEVHFSRFKMGFYDLAEVVVHYFWKKKCGRKQAMKRTARKMRCPISAVPTC